MRSPAARIRDISDVASDRMDRSHGKVFAVRPTASIAEMVAAAEPGVRIGRRMLAPAEALQEGEG
jgi:hypothetical protein